jgi:hypothetical protein
MAIVIVDHPQSRANLLRETLRQDPAVQRREIRVVHVIGTDDALRVLVRNGTRTVSIDRGPEWRALPLEVLRRSLGAQLVKGLHAKPA